MMSFLQLAAICAALGGHAPAPPAGTDCVAVGQQYRFALARIAPELQARQGRTAIARVAYAEAGNQGDDGLAAVVYTIINRVLDGGFGTSLTAVLDAPGQFAPVRRAGGRWKALPAVSPVKQAHIDTILNLALEGRLPDPTNGALYFRNAATMVGETPVAVVKDHVFFARSGQALETTAPELIDATAPQTATAAAPVRTPAVPAVPAESPGWQPASPAAPVR
jgi:spore germination cell wall hydrolase CwlJ-like protein